MDEGLQQDGEIVPINLNLFLKNFKFLYAFAGKHCRCHQQRMTCNNIFSHEGLGFGRWLEGLLAVPKGLLAVPKRLLMGRKKRQRSSAWKRYNERFVKRLVDKFQQQTAAVDQSGEANRANSQPTEMLTLRCGDQEEKNLTQ